MEKQANNHDPDSVIYLVACVKTKKDRPMSARDLYASEWFKRARAYVESTGCDWYILSAEYGLLYPHDVVAPYERTLKHMSAPERRSWGERVCRQFEAIPLVGKTVILLAGRAYREPILDCLRARAAAVQAPMEHLAQGQQLQWLAEHTRTPREESNPPTGPAPASRSAQTGADPKAIREALLDLDSRIDREAMIPTLEDGAARLILEDPYAFLLATCLDRGTRAEIIWTIPTWLQRQWEHLDPHRIRRMDDEAIAEAITNLPKQPRYRGAAVATIRELTRIVVDEYAGDARALWNGRPATEFRFTLEHIPGVGPGIASMAVQLVERLFPDELGAGPTAGLDIKPDVHTRRVLYRLGVAPEITDSAAREAARRLLPEHPGRIDGPLWYIGHEWCHASHPSCHDCHMEAICPRRDVDSPGSLQSREAAKSVRKSEPGKYAPLTDYLNSLEDRDTHVTLSFRAIESIIGKPLPNSASTHRPWWSNHAGPGVSSQARAWLDAGFMVDQVSLGGGKVRFVRMEHHQSMQ